MESTTQPVSKVSVPFLVYMFGVGLGLIVALGYAGYASWPFLATIAVGAVAQLLFRTIKRVWKNSLNVHGGSSSEEPFDLKFVRNLLLAYVAMLAVSALWYGLGRGVRWLSA
jgi:hypothetical protein